MAFPREAALAEVLWTPKARRDFTDFSARLPAELARLQALDVNYRPTAKP
jgi:hexosaminidase